MKVLLTITIPQRGKKTTDPRSVARLLGTCTTTESNTHPDSPEQIAVRKAWLADNTLPEHIRYYSVIAFPDRENISNGLQRFHRKLGELKDGRNDSQVVFYDQVIPGSTILGFFNADHWAMSVPIARQHEITQAVFADQNDFPREIALEAILRYIEEDLEKAGKRPDAP